MVTSSDNEIMVSVVCETYNHLPYIRSALDGFVMQKTDFPFEVVVHDDASTDGTADVVREYMERYPGLIRVILQKENQYSKGVYTDLDCLYPQARGRYLAICEGDDYWTDPYKLQKQFDAMEAHPEVDISAHAAYEEQDGVRTGKIAPSDRDRIFRPEEVIRLGGGFVASASLMFRRTLDDDVPEFRRFFHNDYTTQIHGALRGGMLYLSDCMAVYRYMSSGSWTARMRGNKERKIALSKKLIEMLNILDRETEGKYHGVIGETQRSQEFKILCAEGRYADALKKPYKDIFRSLSARERASVLAKRYLPFLVTWREKLRSR